MTGVVLVLERDGTIVRIVMELGARNALFVGEEAEIRMENLVLGVMGVGIKSVLGVMDMDTRIVRHVMAKEIPIVPSVLDSRVSFVMNAMVLVKWSVKIVAVMVR